MTGCKCTAARFHTKQMMANSLHLKLNTITSHWDSIWDRGVGNLGAQWLVHVPFIGVRIILAICSCLIIISPQLRPIISTQESFHSGKWPTQIFRQKSWKFSTFNNGIFGKFSFRGKFSWVEMSLRICFSKHLRFSLSYVFHIFLSCTYENKGYVKINFTGKWYYYFVLELENFTGEKHFHMWNFRKERETWTRVATPINLINSHRSSLDRDLC
jgi:hypothetical protein